MVVRSAPASSDPDPASSAQPPPLLVELLAQAWVSSGNRYVAALLEQTGCGTELAASLLQLVAAIGVEITRWYEQATVPAPAASRLLAAEEAAREGTNKSSLFGTVVKELHHLLWDFSDHRKGECNSVAA
jgi:hypothetical protein